MSVAIEQAKIAFENNEVPIGCVIVKDDKIIASGYNSREKSNSITAHAEINAINQATEVLNTWKLDGCTMYVTVEPCLMCYGAIIQSRIEKVYIGCLQLDKKPSSYRNYVKEDKIIDLSFINNESVKLMQNFFSNLRKD